MSAIDLFGVRPRRPRRVLMRVIDAGLSGCSSELIDNGATMWARLQCRCGHVAEVQAKVSDLRRWPCPQCNSEGKTDERK